jgi:hypothetical protein
LPPGLVVPEVVVVVVGVVVVVFFDWQPPFGATLSFSQPEKLLMEHSSAAALAKRRKLVKRIKIGWGKRVEKTSEKEG